MGSVTRARRPSGLMHHDYVCPHWRYMPAPHIGMPVRYFPRVDVIAPNRVQYIVQRPDRHDETSGNRRGFSMFGSVEAHAWKVDADGGERAIVPIVMMTSRPPGHASLDVTGINMSELQSIASKLAPSAADTLVAIAKGWIQPAKWKARRT
jgi:hypothetical protein